MNAGELTCEAIARLVASYVPSVRYRAVEVLVSWLPTALPRPSDADLLKLWKGLFYALWHAEEPSEEISLASRFASLIEFLPADLSPRYLSALLSTLRFDWPGIDQLHFERFHALLRFSLRGIFSFLRSQSWDLELSSLMASILFEKSLLSADNHSVRGVNYHIAELLLNELKDFLPIPMQTLDQLLKPFFSLLQRCQDTVLINKMRSEVFDRLRQSSAEFLGAEKKGESLDGCADAQKFGTIVFSLGFSKRFFELALAPETLQTNRKLLFGLRDGFLALEKDLENSGVKISTEHCKNWSDTRAARPPEVEREMGGEDKPSEKNMKSEETSVSVSEVTELVVENKEEAELVVENKEEAELVIGKEEETVLVENEETELVVENEEETVLVVENEEETKLVVENEIAAIDRLKERDKSIKELDGVEKKKRMRKKKKKAKKNKLFILVAENVIAEPVNDTDDVTNTENVNSDAKDVLDPIDFHEIIISNMQQQFLKLTAETAEIAVEDGNTSSSGSVPTLEANSVSKKRKREDGLDEETPADLIDTSGDYMEEKNREKYAKKVRFLTKYNLVWKPHNPLPPQSLRLPPSVFPRGSALKKGVVPGPIKEISPADTEVKLTKRQKNQKRVSAVVQRLRELQGLPV